MESKKHEKKLFSKINKTVEKYQMLQEGDNVLVGLSGGKDSLVLLKALAQLKKKVRFKFRLSAIYIELSSVPYQSDMEYLTNFCNALEVPFLYKKVEVDIRSNDNAKSPCFACSWNRRKSLFEIASNNSFNKLALGHHLDDAIETLLMNMMYQAEISALPPKLDMFDGELTIIRPMIESKESLIVNYSKSLNIKPMSKTCPFEKQSKRQFVKDLLSQVESHYDRAKNNIFISMSNINRKYLP